MMNFKKSFCHPKLKMDYWYSKANSLFLFWLYHFDNQKNIIGITNIRSKRMKNLPLKFVCVKDQWQNLVKLQKKKHREKRDELKIPTKCNYKNNAYMRVLWNLSIIIRSFERNLSWLNKNRLYTMITKIYLHVQLLLE